MQMENDIPKSIILKIERTNTQRK